MGRGRQKAKHTKVARELKYFSPNTDLSALEKELAASSTSTDEPDYEDKWADLYEDEEETEDATASDEDDSEDGSEDEEAKN